MSITHGFDITVDFPRDRWGRPLIQVPGSDKPLPYARPSSFGSVLENSAGLTIWKNERVALGAVERPDLLTLLSAYRDDSKKVRDIVNQLLEAGGASRAANAGTAIHDILAKVNRGTMTVDEVPTEFRQHVNAWLTAVEAHGYEVVADLVERHVVNDEYQTAGSSDVFLRRKSDGMLVACDIKTGKSISPRPLAYMVQLRLYATSVLYDVATGERTPLGPVWMASAIIAHVPANGTGCTFYEVDLDEAKILTDLAVQVRKAEKESKKVVAIDTPATVVPHQVPLIEQRRAWVKDRLTVFLAAYPDSRGFVARCWPEGVPTFKSGHEHDDAEIDRIALLLDKVEAEVSAPFGATDPKILAERAESARAAKLIQEVFPGARIVDDTSLIDDATYKAFKAEVDALEPCRKAWIAARTAEASKAKKSVSLATNPTVRRYEIAQALVALSEYGNDDDIVRALLAAASTEAARFKTVGAGLGSLDLDEAIGLRKIVHALDTGALTLGFSDTGAPELRGDMSAVLAA